MAVFRVERTKDYTVMSNHHLRNKELTLKAKGLLSQMLSLPEDWDYTLKGLAAINRESIDAIRTAVLELEQAGYIVRSRVRDERGCLVAVITSSMNVRRRSLPSLHGKIQHWIIPLWCSLHWKTLCWILLRRKIQRN